MLGKHGFGSGLDDNASALLVAVAYRRLGSFHPIATRMGDAALAFLAVAARDVHDAPPESVGRLIWALGVTATCADLAAWRRAALILLPGAARAAKSLTSLRARAYAILGLAALVDPYEAAPVEPTFDRRCDADVQRWARETLCVMATSMQSEFEESATGDRMWWEPELSYDNARPAEAMLRAAAALRAPELGETGLSALRFLVDLVQPAGTFVPIGAQHQPLEAAATIGALVAAERLTRNESFLAAAQTTYAWFLGKNRGGGCRDAESTLAYLQSALFLESALQPVRVRARLSNKRSVASTTIASIDAARLPATIIDV
jgi:hypothetical protein